MIQLIVPVKELTSHKNVMSLILIDKRYFILKFKRQGGESAKM